MDTLFAVRSLQCYILPGRPPFGFSQSEIYDKAYSFWKTTWTEVFKENGTDKKPNPDDFLRQDRILVLAQGSKPIAMMTCTFFDLDRAAELAHSYFGRYTDKSLTALRAWKISHISTWEFLAVERGWRFSDLGLSLVEVLFGLGLEIVRSIDADAIITVARSDIKMDKILEKFGMTALDSGVSVYNTPCNLMVGLKEKFCVPANQDLNRLRTRLWKNRIDVSERERLSSKKAA